MKVLLLYATNSGSTYLAGRMISAALQAHYTVVFKRAAEVKPKELRRFDLIVIGSPSWRVDGSEGQPHETIQELLSQVKAKKLAKKLFALYGCGDSSYADFCGAVTYLEQFVARTGGKLVLPPLRLDKYFFQLEKSEALTKKWAKELADVLRNR